MVAVGESISAVPGWRDMPFDACIKPIRSRRGTVPQSEYRLGGRFPVVDQGVGLVAGYTDNESFVYRDELPLIVFGDHTRNLKFVEFPFAAGADGTKLLAGNTEVDTRFLYFALLALRIPARGYNRHYRLLRESVLPVPRDAREQRAIAGVLCKIQRAVELEEKRIAALKELKAATMAKVFREGLRGERLKKTEIGEVPESWEILKLGAVARISTGTTPATDNQEFYSGTNPFIKTAEISDCIIDHPRQCVSDDAVERYNLRIYPPGTVLLAMYGQGKTRGRVGLLSVPASTTQNTAAIEPGKSLKGAYLWHYLMGQYKRLRNTGNLGHMSHLNLGYVRDLLVPVPRLAEQEQIEVLLSNVQKRMRAAEDSALHYDRLFGSALHQIMTGKLRVFPVSEEVFDG